MVPDDLAAQRARESAAMVLTQLKRDYPVPVR